MNTDDWPDWNWPERTVARTEEIQLHLGHPVTMTHHKATDAVTLYCDQCKVLLVLNRGREP
jgi:hypothetical protein